MTYSTAFQSADDAKRLASLNIEVDSTDWVAVDTLKCPPAPSHEHMQRRQHCVDLGSHTLNFNAWMSNDDEDTMDHATNIDHLDKFTQQLQAMNAFVANAKRNKTWVLEDKLKRALPSGSLRYQSSTKLSSYIGFLKFGCARRGEGNLAIDLIAEFVDLSIADLSGRAAGLSLSLSRFLVVGS